MSPVEMASLPGKKLVRVSVTNAPSLRRSPESESEFPMVDLVLSVDQIRHAILNLNALAQSCGPAKEAALQWCSPMPTVPLRRIK